MTDALFDRYLTELMDLAGVPAPVPPGDTALDRFEWQCESLLLVSAVLRREMVPDAWFEPLIRVVVHDPNPSFSRQLISPPMDLFGRETVRRKLLDRLAAGSDAERAGAARAWYWAQAGPALARGSREPVPRSPAEERAWAELRRAWRDTALQVFLSHEDIDVRRSILGGLDLRAEHYPADQRAAVARAVHIARTHPDQYLRDRVERQV